MLTLNTNPLLGNYDWIWPGDPAIDVPKNEDGTTDSKALQELYERYLDGTGDLPCKSGQDPTVWELRHLTELERAEVYRWHQRSVRHGQYMATALGVVALRQPDGSRHEADRAQDAAGYMRLTDDEMNRLGEHEGLIADIAARVVRSMSPPKNS